MDHRLTLSLFCSMRLLPASASSFWATSAGLVKSATLYFQHVLLGQAVAPSSEVSLNVPFHMLVLRIGMIGRLCKYRLVVKEEPILTEILLGLHTLQELQTLSSTGLSSGTYSWIFLRGPSRSRTTFISTVLCRPSWDLVHRL